MFARTMLKSKIHRATVTQADLHYVGSVTVDEDLLDAADLLPGEQVAIVDVTNGARLETYVIPGERGSGVIGINGAAAHLVHPGDLVILISYAQMDDATARDLRAARWCTSTPTTGSSSSAATRPTRSPGMVGDLRAGRPGSPHTVDRGALPYAPLLTWGGLGMRRAPSALAAGAARGDRGGGPAWLRRADASVTATSAGTGWPSSEPTVPTPEAGVCRFDAVDVRGLRPVAVPRRARRLHRANTRPRPSMSARSPASTPRGRRRRTSATPRSRPPTQTCDKQATEFLGGDWHTARVELVAGDAVPTASGTGEARWFRCELMETKDSQGHVVSPHHAA